MDYTASLRFKRSDRFAGFGRDDPEREKKRFAAQGAGSLPEGLEHI